ncbi:glucosaminidase [Vibrionales bacterium C3R12]|nr:glucosaminidase [Vibrionales bacterium C3R12]
MRKKIGLAAVSLIAGCSLFIAQQNRVEVEEQKAQAERANKNISLSYLPSGLPDFAALSNAKEKKEAFFDFMRPGVMIENSRIEKERTFLTTLEKSVAEGEVNSEQLDYAQRLGKLYSYPVTESSVNQKWLDEMLHRVNVLPEALVLTQAANESAWGTSRFATSANNFFGQWCYTKGCGVVPLKRSGEATHEVAKFSSVQESIHRYFMNVNRNAAYKELRIIRADRLEKGENLLSEQTATALTNGLLKYSERGQSYVDDLQAMIRHNKSFWSQ